MRCGDLAARQYTVGYRTSYLYIYCGALRGVPLISPQTANGKGLKPLTLTPRGFTGFGSKNSFRELCTPLTNYGSVTSEED